jgi:replicative DNA helicase
MKLYSLELEQSVIGSILIDPDLLPDIQASLPPESFYSVPERVAYTTIATLAQKGSQIDFLTVSDELEKSHPGHGWLQYLATVAKNTPSTANVLSYADAIRQYHYLRRVYHAGEEVCRSVMVDGALSEKIAAAQQAVGRVMELEAGKGPRDSVSIIRDWMDHLEAVQQADGVSGLSSGMTGLDDLTHGMKPGELHILAARPGQGKTVLALQVAYHAAMQGQSVLIFSLEMQARELMSRLASTATGTYYRNIQTGDLCADQWQSITGFVEKMAKQSLYIDDRASLSIEEIRSVSRSHRNRHGVDLVIIDYLQLASGDGESDVVRVGNVSKGCKMMAKELNCPVLALSQFSRGVEQRADGRPKLSDLRSSGQIEQDADVVMMLHRADDASTELIVEKNRHGRTGSVWLQPQFDRMRFSLGMPPVSLDEPPQPKKRLRY